MADPTGVLERLGLTEYEQRALAELLGLGRTTAPTLAEAADIPKPRVYGVLDSLAEAGYVEVFPGRPKEYRARPPADLLDRAKNNRRLEYERFAETIEERREAFLAEFRPRYESAAEADEEQALLRIVEVGEASERETRRLYREAERTVDVLTKSFEYLDSVESALADTLDRGVSVRVLLYHTRLLSDDERAVQTRIVDRLRTHDGVEFRFATGRLPWRGTFVDPNMNYEGGEAIFLVEEPDVPDHMRQAALTENGSFVAGFKRYFDLVWDHESTPSAEAPVAD